MSRHRAIRWLVALSATMAVFTFAAPAVAETQVPAKTTAVVVDKGTVRLVLTVGDLPEGDTLDPGSVRVVADGKRWPAKAEAVTGSGRTVARTAVLAVDTSGSMGPDGIADARSAASRFLAVVPPDVSVGLVTFADRARLVVAPTTDRSRLRLALTRMRPEGDTTLYDGIKVALSALGSTGERALILLSDGKDTASKATLAATGNALSGSGVSVNLVAFRTGDGQLATLDQLATKAKGRVTQADNRAQLADVFASAARTLVNSVNVTVQIPADVSVSAADLTVEVDSESATAVAAVQVELPPQSARADSTGTVAEVQSQVPTSVPWLLPVVLGAAFLGLFLLFAVGLAPSTWQESSSRRGAREMSRYGVVGGAGGHDDGDATPAAATQAALAWAGRTVARRGVENSWAMELDRAAVPLRPQEWLIIRLAVVLCAVALGVLVLPWWLLTAPLLGLVGWLATGAYIRIKAKRRLARFGENLPDVLQLIAGSLRTGFSLPQAVDNAAKDGEQPMAGELSRALAESRLGVELEDSLDRVAERMRSTDLTWTIMAVRIAREVGGNLAEVLMSTAETMRERSRIHRQVKVLSAEGRLSAYVLIGLPVGITLWMLLFRRSYVAPLVTDPIGWVMTTYGVVSVLVGAWWMSRLIKLEV